MKVPGCNTDFRVESIMQMSYDDFNEIFLGKITVDLKFAYETLTGVKVTNANTKIKASEILNKEAGKPKKK